MGLEKYSGNVKAVSEVLVFKKLFSIKTSRNFKNWFPDECNSYFFLLNQLYHRTKYKQLKKSDT